MAPAGAYLLADEPGLGKTLTVVLTVLKRWREGAVVVVCPRNVVKHWRETFKACGFTGQFNLIVTNYEKMDVLENVNDVSELVIDESHKLKNENSVRFQQLYGYTVKWNWQRAMRGISVTPTLSTGTPVYSYPIDLLTSLILLGKLDLSLAPAFKVRYCDPTRQRRGKRFVLDMRGSANLDELKRLCAPFLLRRTWADAGIKMPPVTLTDLEVGAKITDPKYFEASENFKKFYVEAGGNPEAAGLAKHTVLRKILAVAKVPAAVEQALDDLKGGQKTLFFSEFRDVVTEIRDRIEQAGGRALAVLGGQTKNQREEILEAFKSEKGPIALIATTDSLGEGTDGLQEVCHLVNVVDLDFEPSMFVQAIRRIIRLRQKFPVSVRRFFVAGDKMEEFIIENWAKKERILKALGLNSDSSLQALQSK